MLQHLKHIIIPVFICAAALFSTGCKDSKSSDSKGGSGANIYLYVTAASNSINIDQVLWEDRVDELRMIMFDVNDGSVVFNQKLYFPDGFQQRSRSVSITPGTYDFYFIANETVYQGDFVSALMDISNISQFATDQRFTTLAYDRAFAPDGATSEGRFLMSAIYNDITVAAGGTENNPVLLALPTGKVELIRSMAKVEVVFRKRVAGSSVPENAVSSVRLNNVASYLSVPPADTYYYGPTEESLPGALTQFDYSNDSIGSVIFYVPELLLPSNETGSTELQINNLVFPIETDDDKAGLTAQRRSIADVSDNSVIRNYHYLVNAYINAEGGIQLRVQVQPWKKDNYIFIFQGDHQIVIPPVIPTDTSIIIQTECGKIEIHSTNENLGQGLKGAYNDEIVYYDPVLQGPTIKKGDPPYHCEKKYGAGWRLINSCELMSFLGAFDMAYNVWMSNTWEADTYGMPYYPLPFRQAAQLLLERLTGEDLSGTIFQSENNWGDEMVDVKLDIIDKFFTPGDIMLREMDFPGGWPYEAPPGTGPSDDWIYNEVVIQVKPFWYGSSYISPSERENWDRILYGQFERYDFGNTVSRCVRVIE